MSHDNKMAEGESGKNDQKQEENSVSHDLVDELQEIENMVLNPNINVENLVEEASNGTVIYLIFYRAFLEVLQAQGLVTIQVNILSMYKHIQGRTSFFTPARFKSCLFFKFLLIYSKPCLVQLPRPYSFKKYHDLPSTTSCEGAAVVFVRNSPE